MEPPCDDEGLSPCNEALREVYGYLDGHLTIEIRARIKTHLDDCGYCFKAFGFEAELREVIARRCRDDVPETLRLRVLKVIETEIEGRPPT